MTRGQGWWRGRCGARTGMSVTTVRCSRPRWHRRAHVAWHGDRVLAVWDR